MHFGKKQYNPNTYIKDEVLRKEVAALPLEEQQQLAELMSGSICRHTIYVKQERVEEASVFDLDMVPFFEDSFLPTIYKELHQLIENGKEIIKLVAQGDNVEVYFPKTPHIHLFTKYMDGKRSMGELIELVQKASTRRLRYLTW